MITNLREAKSRLSRLVQIAALGEEVVITVRGEPVARLTGVNRPGEASSSRESWIQELIAAAAAAKADAVETTAQEYWDEARQDRFSPDP